MKKKTKTTTVVKTKKTTEKAVAATEVVVEDKSVEEQVEAEVTPVEEAKPATEETPAVEEVPAVEEAPVFGDDNVYVTFQVNESGSPMFAVPKADVLNVIKLDSSMPFTKVPNTESYVDGIVFQEGKMITIINPFRFWSMETCDEQNDQLICMKHDNELIGICAANVENVNVPENGVQICQVVNTKAFAHNGKIYTLLDLSSLELDRNIK